MADFTPGKTGSSRVFLITGRARPDHQPAFQACMMAGALEQNYGDTERIECPDPAAYGQYIEVGEIQGASERPTLPLTGKFAADLASTLADLGKKRCPFDIQVHFGACTDPRVFNTFTKAIVLEKAKGGSYSTDDLGSLASGDEAEINETLETSGSEHYEVLKLSAASVGGDAVTNPLNDVTICSIVSCGDCDDQDAGCEKIYAVGDSTPGSPGTAPDIVYSLDGGANWYAADISTLVAGDSANGVACMGSYVVVVSDDEGALHYILKSDLDTTPPAAGFSQVTTGFVATHDPTDIWSVGNYAFIAAELGYVYGTDDPTAGVTVLDAGVATAQNLAAVHALNDQFAVAVGASNAVVYTQNKTTWTAVTGPAPAVSLTCVWCKSEDEWWVGTAGGAVWYTLDQGVTWTQKGLPGTGYATITDIQFPKNSVGYISSTLTTTAGRILRSYDGGYSWNIMPDAGGVFPANDAINAIAACTNDPNFVVGVGLADDASDGIIIIAQD